MHAVYQSQVTSSEVICWHRNKKETRSARYKDNLLVAHVKNKALCNNVIKPTGQCSPRPGSKPNQICVSRHNHISPWA